MTNAPEEIWAIPTRWAKGHGPDTDWAKGNWHTLQAKSPLCKQYIRKDALDESDAVISALVEALDAVTDKQWVSSATMYQCAIVDAAIAKVAARKK